VIKAVHAKRSTRFAVGHWVLIFIAAEILYGLAFKPLYEMVSSSSVGALSLLPVMIVAWVFGLRAG